MTTPMGDGLAHPNRRNTANSRRQAAVEEQQPGGDICTAMIHKTDTDSNHNDADDKDATINPSHLYLNASPRT